MTSLKLQLSKLVDPHTQWQLTESESRKRASFLYDPKVASTLDRETIYCLGTNGFEELCLLDSAFEEFERVLFSDTSLTFERSVQTKEVNDSLNQTIRRFLIRLSPYFLLSPAHKALEWLVHRFYIHFYNIDDLMRCILPYHEHNYFTRAVQMFRLNDKQSAWSWLEPAQKAGTTISGLVMANHCATDLGFLTFVCESASMTVKEFGSNHSSLRVMINFYLKTLCSTILHSLSHKKKKKKKSTNDEQFIAQFMPYLLKGLKSKCTDFKRANYLILSHLSNIFTFQINIRDEILNIISKGLSDELIQENLLIISVFLNNQHHQSIPDRCFTKLSELTNVVDEIGQLSNEVRIDNFLCAWFEQLLNHTSKATDENLSNLMDKTLNIIQLNSSILKFMINCFIKQFNSTNSKYLVSLASILERKYPIVFDETIREQTEACSDKEKRKQIREFASMTATGFKHQPLSDRASLAICLNHPQAQLRIEALQRIREGIQSKQNIEQEFLIEVLISRLNDHDIEVVQEAIQLLQALKLTDNQQINDILQKILQRENSDWLSVQQSIVQSLSFDLSNESKYIHLLFPSNQSELNLLEHFLDNSKQHKTNPLIKLTKKIYKSTTIDNLLSSIENFLQAIAKQNDGEKISTILFQHHDEILRLVEFNRPNWIKFALIYILLGIQTIQGDDSQLAIIMVLNLLKRLNQEISTIENNQSNEIDTNQTLIQLHIIDKSPLTADSYSYLWKLFIQSLPKDHKPTSFYNDFFFNCLQWLSLEKKSSIMNYLLQEHFPLANQLLIFLAEYYLNLTENNYEQEIILKYLLKTCSTVEYSNLSLLILSFCLHSTYRNIRSITMKLIQNKLQTYSNEFELFIQTIKEHQSEILTDSEYICYSISQLVQKCKLTEKKKRKLNADHSFLINLFHETIEQNNDLNDLIKQKFHIQLLDLFKQTKHWLVFQVYRKQFEHILEQNHWTKDNQNFLESTIQHIDYETLSNEESACFEMILHVLKYPLKKTESLPIIDLMILTLKQFTPEMFDLLGTDFTKQYQLLEQCFALWQRSKSALLTTTIKSTLSKLTFEAKHFLTYWKSILEPGQASISTENRLSNKKLIVSKQPIEQSKQSIQWKSLLPSLELLHNEQLKINRQSELIRSLFQILEKSVQQGEEFKEKVYIEQLCTTALLNLYNRLKSGTNSYSDECQPENFNSEILMECMKRTNDLHTTQQCLMLLSKGAQLFPEKLISMIMAMFAFVGDRLVRKDDLYSYQVMEKTIKTVIPSLYKEKNVEQRRIILAKITHVFVTSLAHLPAHRRQDIFRMLMESIGQDECLWFAPIQIYDSILLSPISRKNEELLKKSLIDANEQMLNSFNQFSSSTILINLTKILNAVLNLPDQISKNQSTPSAYSHLIDLRSYTTKHIHVLKYQLLTFVTNVLSSEFFVKMISKTSSTQENDLNYLNELIQTILHCLLWANKLSEDDIDITRYNKSILNKIYECLNKSIALLNGTMFANIIVNLLQQQQTNDKLQRKTLEILNQRLKDDFTPESEMILFLPNLDNFLTIISKYSTNEQEQTAQTALFTIKLLAKRLAEKHPTEFSSSLTFICQHLRLVDSGQHANLSASIYLCLAELCATLKQYSIAQLPIFMPHVLQTYQSDNVIKNDLLLTSVIACLSKLVRTLCNYLTPYLPEIIKRTCTLLTHPSATNDQRLRTMWSHVAIHVPHRLLFPILHDVIEKNEFQLNDLEPLMTLLKQSLSISTLDDLSTNYSLLKQLFLKLFTLRTTHMKKMTPSQMNVYEDHVLDCFAELVMRLSEETFRPLFYTIYEWAVYNEPPAEYTLTFYRLTFILSKKLKGLFTLFAGHVIQHSANVLNQLNTSKTTEQSNEFSINFKKKYQQENQFELINGILGTLSNLCLFDSVGFITDERFQLLMMPIVDQLENLTSNENYSSWVQQYVSPCIVNLTGATKEETLWRRIHYQILLKTRSDLSKVRLASLHVIQELSRKLGMNYQSLLSEAIPFLAELMEDSNDEVEKTCHRVIVDMESTLGESLQDYFNN